MMEKNVKYVAPMVEVIEVEVEKGFATSNEPVGDGGDAGQVLKKKTIAYFEGIV